MSFNSVIGATVRLQVPDSWGNLGARVVSSLILAPIVLGALYLGHPFADILIIAVAGIAAWEWARLCGAEPGSRLLYLSVATALFSLIVGALGSFQIALWVVLAGGMAAMVLARQDAKEIGSFWFGLGVFYATLPLLAFLWLRYQSADGRDLIFWLLFVVWATDIGAYAAGRLIGGPKLAPSISPKKTWAGLLGGMACAALLGVVLSLFYESVNGAKLALFGAVLAVVAQVGDLFESGVKRHFNVKDSSGLIPGHGGLLDRIDGLISVSLAVAAFELFSRTGG